MNNILKQILVFGIGALVIFAVFLLSQGLTSKFDATEDKRFSIAPETYELLDTLDEIAQFKIYLTGDNLPPAFENLKNSLVDLLEEFNDVSDGKIEYEFVDLYDIEDRKERETAIAKLQENGIPYEAVSVELKNGKQEVFIIPGFEVYLKGRAMSACVLEPSVNESLDYMFRIEKSIGKAEYYLTNALRKLINPKKKGVAFLQGHMELGRFDVMDWYSSLEEYYNCGPVILKDTAGNVSLDALNYVDVLVIAKPHIKFSEKELFVIDQFVMNGGKLCVFQDGAYAEEDSLRKYSFIPSFANKTGLEALLFKYGVKINSDLVEDLKCSQMLIRKGLRRDEQLMPVDWVFKPLLTGGENPHKISRNLDPILLNFASTLDTMPTEGVSFSPLLVTSGHNKYRKTPTRIGFQAAANGYKRELYKDTSKCVAVLAEGKFTSYFKNRIPPQLANNPSFKFTTESKNTQVIVIGDGDVAKNRVIGQTRIEPLGKDRDTRMYYSNKTFLINCLNYLSGHEGIISTRSRNIEIRLLDKDKLEEYGVLVKYLNITIPPAIILLASVFFIFYRMFKYS